MKCPTDKSVLARRDLSGVEVDACLSCGGVWLDGGELERLQEAYLAAHAHQEHATEDPTEEVARAYEMVEQKERTPGACPRCDDALEHVEYAYTSQVVVDKCPHGHGVWLDAGELLAIEQFFEEQRREANQPTGLAAVWHQLVKEISDGLTGRNLE